MIHPIRFYCLGALFFFIQMDQRNILYEDEQMTHDKRVESKNRDEVERYQSYMFRFAKTELTMSFSSSFHSIFFPLYQYFSRIVFVFIGLDSQ